MFVSRTFHLASSRVIALPRDAGKELTVNTPQYRSDGIIEVVSCDG